MKKRRGSHGSARRPIEYILPLVIALLVGCLLWSISVIRASNQEEIQSSEVRVSELSGTVGEIEELAGNELSQENEAMKRFIVFSNSEEFKSVMAAADDIGAIYDESVMNINEACNQLTENINHITEKFDTSINKLKTAKAANASSRNQEKQAAMAAISKLRADNDLSSDKSFEMLISKQEEDKKTLYVSFQKNISEQTAARRQANDDRLINYLSKLFSLEDSEINAAEKAASEFRSSAEAAFSNAQKACKRTPSSAGQELINSLKTPRLSYADFRRQAYDSHSAAIESVVKELNAAGVEIRKNFEQKLQEIKPVTNIQEAIVD